MSGPVQLQRAHFSTPRAAEYFTPEGLQKETGQPDSQFLHVILKELIDNALDAAEKAGHAPEVQIEFQPMGGYRMRLAIHDNGPGIPPEVVEKLLNFAYRTSDKAAYRAPLRGAQGNALKTVLGIPVALGDPRGRLTIEASGVRHVIEIWMTPAGDVKHIHTQTPAATTGTRVETTVPPCKYGSMKWNPGRWLFAFALFNPHARLQIRELPLPFEQPKWRVKTLLTKLESDRKNGTDFFSHKFMAKVQDIFAGLPKPKDVRSFEGNDLPLLFTANEVQQFALEHKLNKAQTKAVNELHKADPETFRELASTPDTALDKIVDLAKPPTPEISETATVLPVASIGPP